MGYLYGWQSMQQLTLLERNPVTENLEIPLALAEDSIDILRDPLEFDFQLEGTSS